VQLIVFFTKIAKNQDRHSGILVTSKNLSRQKGLFLGCRVFGVQSFGACIFLHKSLLVASCTTRIRKRMVKNSTSEQSALSIVEGLRSVAREHKAHVDQRTSTNGVQFFV
jgi:hypothetical protein